MERMPHKKIIRYAQTALLCCFAAVALLLIISTLPFSGIKMLAVLSGSMEPALPTGSVVLVWPASAYSAGDIVTFRSESVNGATITHRIVDVRQYDSSSVFVTKGDANASADSKPLSSGEIIGKVRLVVPFAGYGIDAVRTPIGFALIILVPALFIILREARSIFTELRKFINKSPAQENKGK